MSENAGEAGETVADSLWDGLKNYFRTQGYTLGAVDVLFLDRARPWVQLARLIQLLTCFIEDAGARKAVFRKLAVILPGPQPNPKSGLTIKDYLDKNLEDAKARLPDGVALEDWVSVIHTDTRQEADLVSALANVPERSAVVIQDATVYRAAEERSYDPGDGHVRIEEDLWALHLLHVIGELEKVAKERQLFVIVNALRLKPQRLRHQEALQKINGAIWSGERPNLDSVILANEVQIASRLKDGRIGEAMAAIDNLSAEFDADKPFLKVQMLHRGGLLPQALDLIEQEFSDVDDIDPMSLMRLAIIAKEAGGRLRAATLLRTALKDATNREELETGLELADELDDFGFTPAVEAKLTKFYPESEALHRFRRERAVSEGRFEEAAKLFAGDQAPSLAAFYWQCAALFKPEGALDYSAIERALVATAAQYQEHIISLLVGEGLRRKQHVSLYDWLMSKPKSRIGATKLLTVLEELVLQRQPAGKEDSDASGFLLDLEQLMAGIAVVIEDMATKPEAGARRVRVNAFLSPAQLGSHGLPMAIMIALRAFARSRHLVPTLSVPKPTDEEREALSDFLEGACGWLERENGLIVGRAKLPEELLTVRPDVVIHTVSQLLQMRSVASPTEADVKELTVMVLLGTAVAPYATDKNSDLALMRLAASKLAVEGQVQQARNLAGSIMEIAQTGDLRRKRLAWFALADVYHRLGNTLESLIAMAGVLYCGEQVTLEQVAEETFLIARLCRDLNLFDDADHAIQIMDELIKESGQVSARMSRFVLLKLQIEQMALSSQEEVAPAKIVHLLERFADNIPLILEQEADVLPPAAAFGQALRIAKGVGAEIPERVALAFEELRAAVPKEQVGFIDALSAWRPTADQLFDILKRTEAARYADDAGFDANTAALLAHRYLREAEESGDSDMVALAIELVADRATATPGWTTIARPPEAIVEMRFAGEAARAISKNGVAVLLMAQGGEDNIVRLIADEGELGKIGTELEFSMAAFRNWQNRYPFAYGEAVEQRDQKVDPNKLNEFYLSTEQLKFASLPQKPLVVVADVQLQSFPPNLIRIGEAFAGLRQPIGAAPSLSWLVAAEKRPLPQGKRVAWISAGEKQGTTLLTMAERLSEPLKQHGFKLNTDERLPRQFEDAELAIMVAHGGLMPDGSFFQQIRDEGQVVVEAGAFAGSFRNAGVAVLFVCSGGRLDRHPGAIANVGLANHVLDAGATAVVASPWPVESRVTYHWVPAFLAAWDKGLMLCEAVFEANETVRKAMDSPASTLAMNVYGNSLVRRAKAPAKPS